MSVATPDTSPAGVAAETAAPDFAETKNTSRPRVPDERWNFAAALIDACGWPLGVGFASAHTILPAFVGELTDSKQAIGMVQSVYALGMALPGLFLAGWLDRRPRIRGVVVWVGLIERLPLALLVPATLWLGPTRPTLLLWLFFAGWLTWNLAMGINMPAYSKLITKTVSTQRRGLLFGLGGAMAGILGAVAGKAAGGLLGLGFPDGYAWCFAIGFVVMTVTLFPLGMMREPEEKPPPRTGEPWWREAKALWHDHPQLRRFIAIRALYAFTSMAPAFYTDYALKVGHVSAGDVGTFTALTLVGGAVGGLVGGLAGDRHGNRALLLTAVALGMIPPLLLLGPVALPLLFAVFALSALARGAWDVGSYNFLLELGEKRAVATTTALALSLVGPASVVAPLLGARLVEGGAGADGYRLTFVLSTVAGLPALALLRWGLRDPRRYAEAEA